MRGVGIVGSSWEYLVSTIPSHGHAYAFDSIVPYTPLNLLV